jgi:hypothetical protein
MYIWTIALVRMSFLYAINICCIKLALGFLKLVRNEDRTEHRLRFKHLLSSTIRFKGVTLNLESLLSQLKAIKYYTEC